VSVFTSAKKCLALQKQKPTLTLYAKKICGWQLEDEQNRCWLNCFGI
jgi:hypothetical protein